MRCQLALVALVLATVSVARAEPPKPLVLIPLKVRPGLTLDKARLACLEGPVKTCRSLDRYTVAGAGAAGPETLAPSWTVDFDQPSVQARLAELRERHGAHPTVAEVTSFVATRMKGSYRADVRVASQVATQLIGDCTEHSLLLAALLRGVGIPSRMVAGVVLIVENKQPLAVGHAWVEAYVNGAWQPADAAIPFTVTPARLRLPFAIMHEGLPDLNADDLPDNSKQPNVALALVLQ